MYRLILKIGLIVLVITAFSAPRAHGATRIPGHYDCTVNLLNGRTDCIWVTAHRRGGGYWTCQVRQKHGRTAAYGCVWHP
jgi:hypothetical protein